MNTYTVRIENIKIENFKNVRHGSIYLENPRKNYKASILGLYGQNGSGKTALIDALSLLKYLLMGQQVPLKFAECINVDADQAIFTFLFKIICNNDTNQDEYKVRYQFSIRKDIDDNVPNLQQNTKFKVTVFNEILSAAIKNVELKTKFTSLIDTNCNAVFKPISKYKEIIGNNKIIETNLLVSKKIAEKTSRSFIFSKELLTTIRENCLQNYYLNIYNALVNYGNFELFIIDTTNIGLISINACLPFAFTYEEKGYKSVGTIMLQLNGVSVIPKQALEIVQKVVASMNYVLKEMLPGLTINVKELGTQMQENGIETCSIQLLSLKNNKVIPLQYESEGIKKIISILNLLINVYNKPSITVAIDELDAGIFEYLLGELLRIIAEKGKGQLIFTSHNLRPLETLDRSFIAFTTTNPDHRYIRLTNVKTNNNLRDFYYRDILLGEQKEPVYEPTNNSDIALAFKKAGVFLGA
jgi:AAA15 family ATPase/GTPase